LTAVLALVLAFESAVAEPGTPAAEPITVDAAAGGRIFEGIGAVSAGASSRLLIEYPEKQRAEVLDWLFKPHFGAGFQHLKVEIGGEVNSTDGIELTHMRSRDEENYQRGYEWWLMKEARKRNRDIILDSLAWGAPRWIGGGNFYSQDMADYVVKFLRGAKTVHGLDIAYTGIWNETPHDVSWIKRLRRTLDASGLQGVGIVAADNYARDGWLIVDEMQADPELRAAVARVGVHYRECKSPPEAQQLGCPLWSSEDGPWRGDWQGTMQLARTINRNYVTGKFTKTEIWSPVTSYYDCLPLPGSGVMRANEPWSGHYEVQPAVWAVAHTTQFAQPGWRYIDPACVLINGGSVVALVSPDTNDVSLVIETMDATSPQTVRFQIAPMPVTALHVWRTSKESPFRQLADIQPAAGVFALTVEPGCIYSLTSTSGQARGETRPPASLALPLPFAEDFSSYQPGDSPRLFSDQSGVFEVAKRSDGRGHCLRQMLPNDGIPWHSHANPKPETILGDLSWTDYALSVDARIPTNSYALLLGRVTLVPQNDKLPNGYAFKVGGTGEWEIRAIRTQHGRKKWTFETSGDVGPPLAQGRTELPAGAWHQLEARMTGDRISLWCNGRLLGSVNDTTHARGLIGLGCDWSGGEFANLAVRPQKD
jgi:galactosylceramidase